ncbi:MAG TPA: choice-of-anchor J domain-containing protein [Nannocystaceae bacterium]|nr:choice-of-anchor J domain-containing protein [Nannocystaceae bacterium]
MLVTGCPGDGTNATGTATEGEDTSSSGGNDEDSATLTSPDTTVSSTMTDPTTTSPDTTADSSSSEGETGCMGECATADDCAPGQSCISCLCVGEPKGCAEWGAGLYGDCLADDGSTDLDACGDGRAPGCVVDNVTTPTAGVCYYSGCTEMCDCPQPPEGFDAQVECADLVDNGEGVNECYIGCGGNDGCPDGMYCLGGTLCVFGEEPMDIPPYGDCVNVMGQCEGGICISDNPMAPSFGGCNPACMDVGDCPAAPSGDAPVTCDDLTGDDMNECFLDCSGGETCPDGMVCVDQFGLCAWEFIPPAEPGYGDCANYDAMQTCLDEETCLDDASGSVCTATCTMASDCPDEPTTGDAPVTCGDLGAGNTCYLDCSGGQTCPDQMECLDDNYCHFVALSFLLDEDFEGGALPGGWTVIDEDMNTPNMAVDFVDAAWVVTDVVEPGTNNAAYSTSWYTPAGQSDDWLITPQFMVGATSQVRWFGFATDPNYADGYEVRISTTGDQPDDFMVETVLFSIDNEAQDFTFHTVDISSYSGQMVYLAWRNNSNDDNLLLIDNIQVTE